MRDGRWTASRCTCSSTSARSTMVPSMSRSPRPRSRGSGSQDFYQFVDAYARGGNGGRPVRGPLWALGHHPSSRHRPDADDSNLATFNTTLYGPRGMTSGRFGRSAMPASGGWGYLGSSTGPCGCASGHRTAGCQCRCGLHPGCQRGRPRSAGSTVSPPLAHPGQLAADRFGEPPLHGGLYDPREIGVCVNCRWGHGEPLPPARATTPTGTAPWGLGGRTRPVLAPSRPTEPSWPAGAGPAMTDVTLPAGAPAF